MSRDKLKSKVALERVQRLEEALRKISSGTGIPQTGVLAHHLSEVARRALSNTQEQGKWVNRIYASREELRSALTRGFEDEEGMS